MAELATENRTLSEEELRKEVPTLVDATVAILGAKPKYLEQGFDKFLARETDTFSARIEPPVRGNTPYTIAGHQSMVELRRSVFGFVVLFTHVVLMPGSENVWSVSLISPASKRDLPSVGSSYRGAGKS